MIAELKNIATLLASDPLTVQQVIAQLGAVTTDYGSNVLVAPNNPLFREAEVVRKVDLNTFDPLDTPANIHLTPVEPMPVAQLTGAFGAFHKYPARRKQLPTMVFDLDVGGQPCAVALIASIKDDQVVELTLRRDIRLE